MFKVGDVIRHYASPGTWFVVKGVRPKGMLLVNSIAASQGDFERSSNGMKLVPREDIAKRITNLYKQLRIFGVDVPKSENYSRETLEILASQYLP